MTTLIQDLGTFVEVDTKQRVTAHLVRNLTTAEKDFITVPEKHPYPCFGKPLYLGLWDAEEFAARFTRTCNT